MCRVLRALGLEVEIHIPDRIFEGYGPNATAIKELIEKGAKLLVLVDCGSTSYAELDDARSAGIDIIIFDHHQTNDELPDVHALVNPNRSDDLSGQGHLCAVGVCYLGLVALLRQLRESGNDIELPNLLDYLDLVALGTICDVVPLKGVNRAFVLGGLSVIRQQTNLGLSALCEVAKLGGPVSSIHFGFILGPRINAGGRIGDAALGAKLLTSDSKEEVEQIAKKLDSLNRERQAIERKMLQTAYSEADAEIYRHRQRSKCLNVIRRVRLASGCSRIISFQIKRSFCSSVVCHCV